MTGARLEERSFDLAIVGGGLAGLCAAVAAARSGVCVALIHDRPVLGGNSSSEIRVTPAGSASYQAWAHETGIIEELLLADRARNHVQFWENGLTNSLWDMTLLEAARAESNLTVFLNCTAREVETIDQPEQGEGRVSRRIQALRASQLTTAREFRIEASQFVDCSGDGTLGALAGADFRQGREARAEFDEPLAPVEADDVTMGATISLRAMDVGRPVPYLPPLWAHEYRSLKEIGPGRTLRNIHRAEFGGFWWLEVGHPFDQVSQAEEVRDVLLQHALGVWNYLKNHSPERERLAGYALDWVGMLPGKRESRRLVGDVIVTEHDVHTDRLWPDRVAYAGWYIDLHIKGGILNKDEPGEPSSQDDNYRYWVKISPYSVPLRACYSVNVANLWMAGRILSTTHVALGTYRVQSTLGLIGQAVGTAAAHAIATGSTPRQVAEPGGEHIGKVQQRLLRDDVHVLDMRNNDPQDLARSAHPSATSEAWLDFGGPMPGEWEDLSRSWAQVFPVTDVRVETVEFFLRNDQMWPVEIEAEIEELERIWDRGQGKSLGKAIVFVPARSSGWFRAAFAVNTDPGRPHRVSLTAAPGVYWARASYLPTGTVSQFLHVSRGGCAPENERYPFFQPASTVIPAYRHWIQDKRKALATRVEPVQRPYGAENVVNGHAWPYAMPNLWASDPSQGFPQSVELEFEEPCDVDTVEVKFDTDLNISLGRAPAFWRASTCVRHWRLYARADGQWQQVFDEEDNYLRKRVARFELRLVDALRIEVIATNEEAAHAAEATETPPRAPGVPPGPTVGARIYEVRAYCERSTT